MSLGSEQKDTTQNIRSIVKSGEFYCNKTYRENEKSLRSFKPVIRKQSPAASEKELAVYHEYCKEGKVPVDQRALIWTELLGVRNIESESFIGCELHCRLECLEIIDKDVPRSLHDVYKDPEEKVKKLTQIIYLSRS